MILFRLEWFLECNNSHHDIMSDFHRARCAVDSRTDVVTNVQRGTAQRRICAAVLSNIQGGFYNVTHDAILTALENLCPGGHYTVGFLYT